MSEHHFNSGLYSRWRSHPNSRLGEGNAREKAYWIIRDKIIYLDLKPGEPVSDKVLAEQLQMSRTPVREALILLSAYNMVVMKPQIGTFVAPIDVQWVEMEQFSRLAMEKEMIRLACAERNEDLLRKYETNIRAFEFCNQSDAPDRVQQLQMLDNEFHGLAFGAAGRERNYFHMMGYMQHIERLRVLTLKMGVQKDINHDHSLIAQAVAEGDKVTALEHLENHLHVYQDCLKLIQERNPEYFTLR